MPGIAGTNHSKTFALSHANGHDDPPMKLNGTNHSKTFAPSNTNGRDDPPMKLNGRSEGVPIAWGY